MIGVHKIGVAEQVQVVVEVRKMKIVRHAYKSRMPVYYSTNYSEILHFLKTSSGLCDLFVDFLDGWCIMEQDTARAQTAETAASGC